MGNQTSLDLDAALVLARKAAGVGRQILLDYFGQLTKVSEKAQAGLVTEADVESEKAIRKVLQDQWPDGGRQSGQSQPTIGFVGEEEAFAREQSGKVEWPETGDWWFVDPLDGTTNYVHRFPIFCVSIGLMLKGQLVLGVVDVPKLDQVYWARRGGGAFMNGQKISCSDRGTVRDSLLATGFFRDQPGDALAEQLRIFEAFVYEARGIRRAGAAAYDLCLVAEGVYDAFWEKNLKPWDVAAGIVLIEEAGGRISDYCGDKYSFSKDGIVAANSKIHPIIIDTIEACPG